MKTKIYILHGWSYSTDKWEVFTKLLKNAGFIVTILKIPGLTEKSDEVWTLGKYNEWLTQKLAGEKSKIILLGHSNGGRIAITYALSNPEQIKKLILMDSAGIYHRELSLEIKRFVFRTASRIGKKVISAPALKKFLYKLAREKDYIDANPNMKQSMINLIETDLKPFLNKLKVQTLIIWGEGDKITPLADASIMQSIIKNSKLEIIKGARHSPFYTHPEKVVEIIKNDI